MIPVALLYAGLLALLGVLLANQVLYVRLRPGREPEWRADATLRTQANFVENVPLALLLLYLLEIGGIGSTAVHGLGASLFACRLLHAWGMSRYPGANYPRLIGAQGTFVVISVMGAAAVYLYLLR
jgi:uncharacterized membrane protein YecN with MAPEG domain